MKAMPSRRAPSRARSAEEDEQDAAGDVPRPTKNLHVVGAPGTASRSIASRPRRRPWRTVTFWQIPTAPAPLSRLAPSATRHGDAVRDPRPGRRLARPGCAPRHPARQRRHPGLRLPVGTRGTVKTQTLAQLERLAPPILLANTYHLLVRPGPEVFETLRRPARLDGPRRGALLTDSGGFQLFSLAHARAMSEEGPSSASPPTCRACCLTPGAIAMQRAIGSDIMMVLDHCIDATAPHAGARRWS